MATQLLPCYICVLILHALRYVLVLCDMCYMLHVTCYADATRCKYVLATCQCPKVLLNVNILCLSECILRPIMHQVQCNVLWIAMACHNLPYNDLSQMKVYLDCQAQSYACVGTLVPLLLLLSCIAPRKEWYVPAMTWGDLESMMFGPLQDSMQRWRCVCDTIKWYALLSNMSTFTIQNAHVATQVQHRYLSEKGCATLGHPPACLQVQECQSQC